MMKNFFKSTTSKKQDDLESDGSEREDLDGMRGANQAMDCEEDEDERWGDEQPEEGELRWVEGAGGRREPEDQPQLRLSTGNL